MTTINNFIEQCQNVQKDIKNVLDDFEFGKSGKLYYAVDFSEVFTYTLPHLSQDLFTPFSEGEPAQSLELYILRHLLYGDAAPILLPPYALELRRFIRTLRSKSFDHLIEDSIKFLIFAEDKLDSSNFHKISSIVQEVEKKDRELSVAEQNLLVDFLEVAGDSLLTFLDLKSSDNVDPYSRLQKLSEDKRLATLNDYDLLKSISLTPGSGVAERWYNTLSKLRGEHKRETAKIDAMAVDTLIQINSSLPENEKLLLITRSKHMLAISEHNGSKELSNEVSYLRHPRTFLLNTILNDLKGAELLQRLRGQINGLLESVGVEDKSEYQNNNAVNEYMVSIREGWGSVNNLAMTLLSLKETQAFSGSLDQEPTSKIGDIQRAVFLVKFINDHSSVIKLIQQKLDALAKDLALEHEFFPIHLYMPSTNSWVLSSLTSPEIDSSDTYITTSIQSMPYNLVLETEQAKRLLGLLGKSDVYDWKQVLRFFRDSFDADNLSRNAQANYERLLTMGYVLGVLNKWSVAKYFLEQAIEFAQNNTIQEEEAIFFRCVAMRKICESRSYYLGKPQRAANLYSQCISTLKSMINKIEVGSERRFRYSKELGTQILLVNLYFPQYEKIPSPNEGIKFLRDVLSNLTNSTLESTTKLALKVQILNNLLFFMSNSNYNTYQVQLDEMNELYLQLQSVQSEMDENVERWLPSILDTTSWYEWRKCGDTCQETDQLTILNKLKIAKNSNELTDRQAARISEHILAVEKKQMKPFISNL